MSALGLVLYRWPDGVIVRRLMSDEDMERLQRFRVPPLGESSFETSYPIFSLESPNSVDSVVSLESMIGRFSTLRRWEDTIISRVKGIDRWSAYALSRPRRIDHIFHDDLTDLLAHTNRWATFLFSYLGLDPQYIRAEPRLYFQVPYINDWAYGALSEVYRIPYQMPGGEANYDEPYSPRMKGYIRDIGLDVGLPSVNEPTRQHMNMRDPFCEITVIWMLGNQIGPKGTPITHWPSQDEIDPDALKIYFQVKWGPRGGAWALTVAEALDSVGVFTDEEGLDRWLSDHYIEGSALIGEESFEAYDLLDEDPPPLWKPERLAEFVDGLTP